MLDRLEIKQLLDSVYDNLDPAAFIREDPLSIPKGFDKLQDIEIAALFSAVLAWGQRKTIIKNLNQLMDIMDRAPHQFVMDHTAHDLKQLTDFKHRTFNGEDAVYFMTALKHVYSKYPSMEGAFTGETVKERLHNFHTCFFGIPNAPQRSRKHIADPFRGSAAKRMNMFLRWMVRSDGIDLGLWNTISPGDLKCPLDVHVKRSAAHLGLLKRKQNDWKAVEELSDALKTLDEEDPIRYDLALFSLSESGMITE